MAECRSIVGVKGLNGKEPRRWSGKKGYFLGGWLSGVCIGVEGRGGGDVGRGMRGRLWSMRKVFHWVPGCG